MGARDILTKQYMAQAEHFADAFNYYIFQGKQIIKSSELQELDTAELEIVFGNNNEEVVQKFRDILKSCIVKCDSTATYIMLGIENQSDIHYAMPVKDMIYDALNYAKQVSDVKKRHRNKMDLQGNEFLSGFSKNDKIKPVITLSIYFGSDNWDAPKTLYEMFEKIPEALLKYVNNYKLNLIVPKEIEDFSLFTTELRNVLQVISISDSKETLKNIANDSSYRHLHVETVRLINECTQIGIPISEGEVEIDMCKGMKELLEEQSAKTRADDIERMLINGKTPEQIADFCGYEISAVQEVADRMKQMV